MVVGTVASLLHFVFLHMLSCLSHFTTHQGSYKLRPTSTMTVTLPWQHWPSFSSLITTMLTTHNDQHAQHCHTLTLPGPGSSTATITITLTTCPSMHSCNHGMESVSISFCVMILCSIPRYVSASLDTFELLVNVQLSCVQNCPGAWDTTNWQPCQLPSHSC